MCSLLENIGKYAILFPFLKVSQSRLENTVVKKINKYKEACKKFCIARAGIKCHKCGETSGKAVMEKALKE